MSILLDTHAWLWYVTEDKRLSLRARKVIGKNPKAESLNVSIMSCWEMSKLVEKGKLKLAFPLRDWLDSAIRVKGICMQELTPEICIQSTELPGKFHGDPADQIITATARILRVPLVTADKKILDYQHVNTIW